MTSVIEAIILGIIQGITEWLPVSSSGHLVIAQHLMGIEANVFFDILLHIGTLIVVCIVFWKDIRNIIFSLFLKQYQQYRPLLWWIILGSIATAIIGLTFKDLFIGFFDNLLAVGVALLVTTLLLVGSSFPRSKSTFRWYHAIIIGLVQGIAIIPGISRSGSTISVALLRGIGRQEAARFSFLLMIPAVIGAFLLQLKDITSVQIDIIPASIGTFVAMVVGYGSLKFLLRIIQRGKLQYFAWYTGIVGIILIVSQVFF